jgi:hypothetical protein
LKNKWIQFLTVLTEVAELAPAATAAAPPNAASRFDRYQGQ